MNLSTILVIGSLNMDWIIKTPHTPLTGETLMGEFSLAVPGGKGANQAYTCASLGATTSMLGAVGQDAEGTQLINNLNNVGVDTSNLLNLEGTKTGLALIYVSAVGDNTIVVLPNANEKVTPDYITQYKHLLASCNIILLQMEIPLETLYFIIDLAHSLGKTIILNPAPAPDSIPDDILAKIDYLTPNETELATLSQTSTDSLEGVTLGAQSLLSKGVKNVITTLGSRGALLVTPERTQHFPGHTVTPVDTTAAGDSFNGAIATYLSQGKSIDEAITFANKVASITVTRVGAQSSIPSLKEVQNIL